MIYFKIVQKQIKAQIIQYKLIFLGNAFVIAVLCCYAYLSTNQTFMNYRMISSAISGKITLAVEFISFFIFFFTLYSFHSFFKARKYYYGVVQSIGMEIRQVVGSILIENFIIFVMAICTGLLLGTFFSFLLYNFMIKGLNLTTLAWYFNVNAYKLVIMVYFTSVVVATILNLINLGISQVTELLKERFHTNGKNRFVFSLKSKKIHTSKHLISKSLIRKHVLSWISIWSLCIFFIVCSLFFFTFGLIYYDINKSNQQGNVYDLEYAQINKDINQVSPQIIEQLMSENKIKVTKHLEIEYLNSGVVNVLSVDQVNRMFHTHFVVSKGDMMNLFLYDTKKEAKMNGAKGMNQISFSVKGRDLTLTSCGSAVQNILDYNRALADYTILINNKDFDTLKADGNITYVGKIQMFQFDHWEKSKQAIDKVQKYLNKANNFKDPTEADYFTITSQIGTYTENMQESKIGMIVFGSIFFIFYLVSVMLIYYKLKEEKEEYDHVIQTLHQIGMTKKEFYTVIQYKNFYAFIPHVVIAVIIAVIIYLGLNDRLIGLYDTKVYAGILFSATTGCCTVLCQYLLFYLYTKNEKENVHKNLT